MTKKGENIYKRKDGRWEGRYIKSRDVSRQIIYGYVYGKKYAEVKEKLTVMKAKTIRTPFAINQYYGTLKDWISFWMVDIMKKNIKSTTYYSYYRLIDNHILQSLGDYRLHEITKKNIQDFVDSLERNGLSSGTIRNIYNILKKCLNAAVQREYLAGNPCIDIVLPKYRRKKVHALTLAQQEKLEAYAFQDKDCSPIILALYSGMRIGEISGLKWTDIDFEENTIFVKRTVSRILDESTTESKTKIDMNAPKTWESERMIPLATNLKDYLISKKRQACSDHVISCRGKFAEPRVINYRFQKIVAAAGLEKTHFHALRHTFATRCLENGVDIASLSKLLGHQSTRMTLDTYTDSMLEKRQEAIQILDERLTRVV
ncbi:tyrosine-type recombinase/integrase [Enterococcus sp. BWR-S5]|uniref:tyrosine-type recombinase/integrase n=1 Tax=Enterococcus sp. BWR-S5 TaxID=2787714 RepID=UPI00192096DD|nr:site-specific integrase [Enterococcus sp. BWR-S5]MBL1227571.1 site-specific integrase [Enterococcus sp. BWR-S5]